MYEKISKYFSSPFYVALFLVLLCVGGYYCYEKFYRETVHSSDTVGVPNPKKELERAISNQQEATRTVEQIHDRIGNVQEGIGKLEDSASRTEQLNRELVSEEQRAGELIEECQRILDVAGENVSAREKELKKREK